MDEVGYACPLCKGELVPSGMHLRCAACDIAFRRQGGLLDFTTLPTGAGRLEESPLKKAYGLFFDLIAPIYESWLWYQLGLNLSGARDSSIASIARFVGDTLGGVAGSILDVACGTATYGRRIALPTRRVYGVDLSPGMLRRGAANLVREGIVGVTLARANVERLPFADESFDGAICCGSLHLFPDPLLALKEIRRAMRPGAPLAVQTFLMRRKPGSEGLKDRIGYHQYEVEELRSRLEGAGFAGISIRAVGTVLLASAARPGGRA